MKISVSILDANYMHLYQTLHDLKKYGFNSIHLDVMDGNFVPRISYGSKMATDIIKEFLNAFYLEAHLMVNDCVKQFQYFAKSGIRAYIIHFETLYYREIKSFINDIRAQKIIAGLCVNPKTNIEQIYEFIDTSAVGIVQIMTVEPGMGGQSFMTDMLPKIKKLNEFRQTRNLNFEILVDGGVTPEFIPMLSELGVDRVVIGSYIFRNGIEECAKKLLND